ncbi:hypothetical protein I7I51_07411 [Histoplasma capsulatum]|uniref:Uncharacterized protein n=1 Tax=Ajellomyces capsulatus TaxID=5037 RepID=A0A8A1M0P2_AJECA|nr:hypothetical protein I7I51_07411 [Histoplasma capsulatum]
MDPTTLLLALAGRFSSEKMVCLPDVHEESHLCFASEAQVTLIRAPTIILGTNLRCRFDGQTSASWRPLQQPNKTARSCAQITHDPREVRGKVYFPSSCGLLARTFQNEWVRAWILSSLKSSILCTAQFDDYFHFLSAASSPAVMRTQCAADTIWQSPQHPCIFFAQLINLFKPKRTYQGLVIT